MAVTKITIARKHKYKIQEGLFINLSNINERFQVWDKELNSAYENRKMEARVKSFAQVLRYGDKELVMGQARKNLKDTEFHVYDDIPKLLYDSKKAQMKKLQKAREKGFITYFSKAQPDKVYVNGKYIVPGEPIEWYPSQ